MVVLRRARSGLLLAAVGALAGHVRRSATPAPQLGPVGRSAELRGDAKALEDRQGLRRDDARRLPRAR